MLSAKIGYVPIISIENKRETKKNVITELFKTLLNTRLYEQLKKCKKNLKKFKKY
jgi:hypothetical protein